jgi:signal transduction histidine kinase/ActR/RegA family two-component response regulator
MNRWFDVYATRLGGAGSDLVAVLFSDITQRLLAEQDMRRLNDELAQANRRKTEFLATLAHELRNPLAPLSNGLHLMRLAGGKPEMLEKTRQMMERQVQHMVHLVDDLLDVARISTGKVELRRRRIDLKEVVATAVETSAALIEAGRHKLNLEVPPQALPMDADPTRIAQVVSNLLNNAAKYTPEAGRITLKVGVEGNEAVLSVTDTGIGIDPDALAKVFEMFAQVPSSVAKPQGGLGIGLSLVQSLVALHGGSVSAASPGVGRGSTFTVRLPLANGSDAGGGSSKPPADAAPAGQLQVLVVDDNKDAAESLGVLLEIEGHATHIAHTGAEALQLAQAQQPLDIVFLDIGLPDMSGYEVARRLRLLPGLDKTLLVALTGWGTEDDRQRTREAGFDRHLTKPAELPAVEELLHAAAQAKGGQR